MAFSSTPVFLHTSEERAVRQQQEAGLLADHVITDPASGTATGVAITRTSVLAVFAVSARPATAGSNPRRRRASQATSRPSRTWGCTRATSLRPGTVAVDITLADSAHASVGDRIELRLPDGDSATPEIVAVYTRGPGLGRVTLPASDLTGHSTAGTPPTS